MSWMRGRRCCSQCGSPLIPSLMIYLPPLPRKLYVELKRRSTYGLEPLTKIEDLNKIIYGERYVARKNGQAIYQNLSRLLKKTEWEAPTRLGMYFIRRRQTSLLVDGRIRKPKKLKLTPRI